jgi:ribonuclease Z
MARLVVLGSSNAIPTEGHENTHFALVGSQRTCLVDCVANPILRLPRAGIVFDEVTDLILTHFHPDHISGVPLLLMNLWLMGRKRPLEIHGLDHTLDRIEALMDAFDWKKWPNFYPVRFNRIPESRHTPVLENEEFRIFSWPVQHLIPTIGLRIEFVESGKVLAYSGDTMPSPAVVELAQNADVLIHESAGRGIGHSSAAQAGEIASEAGARELYLIHYQTFNADPHRLLEEARTTFPYKVALAEDFMEIDF